MAWFKKDSVSLSKELFERASETAAQRGYSSVEEFVQHCVRKELDDKSSDDKSSIDEAVRQRLRGLGYVE